ncbi:MAG TPA: prolyl oligopeptidase family serine peptidase [Thermoanaerobaculia bacterium]|nr:prolyl oligopeptidase family serine peptidase [Thermoanaerobaculia bacterium]
MRAKGALVLLLLMAGLSCSRCTARYWAERAEKRFLERNVTVDGTVYKYRVFLPNRFSPAERWPVILFLHGSGERGDDGLRQATVGIGPALLRHSRRIGAVVVLPQARDGRSWVGPMQRVALAALDEAMREFHGDPERVYLTGISMGGSGAWYLARQPRFAAVVPVCGEVVPTDDGDTLFADATPDVASALRAPDPYAELAREIGRVPLWAFHGADDDVIPAEQSRRMVAALGAISSRVRYTEYPRTGHGSWDRAYSEPELWSWLFAQRLRTR